MAFKVGVVPTNCHLSHKPFYLFSPLEIHTMRRSRANEDDWLLDGGRRRKERNWIVTFFSFFFCLLYLVALAMALGSVGYFGAVQYHVNNWNESESKNKPCILYSTYNKERDALDVGENIYCILNIGGDVILALLCLVLLVISLFQMMCGVWWVLILF